MAGPSSSSSVPSARLAPVERSVGIETCGPDPAAEVLRFERLATSVVRTSAAYGLLNAAEASLLVARVHLVTARTLRLLAASRVRSTYQAGA